MSCTSKPIGLLLGAHLDGQLDAVKTLEVEDHLASCETCRERLALDRALRGSLKKAVQMPAPAEVRARMLVALSGESARQAPASSPPVEVGEAAAASASSQLQVAQGEVPAARGRPAMLRQWRTMLPLASAAALALAWGYAGNQPVIRGMPSKITAGPADDTLLRDFVAQHSRPVPPEQQDPKQVRAFERYVGVPVHVPHFAANARFVGGRLVPVHGGERAAMLQYEVQQGANVQRVTVFVYDPRKVQVGGINLSPRAVGTSEVRVGQTDGYSVAVAQHRGVGYAIASDLDTDSSANLVAAADAE